MASLSGYHDLIARKKVAFEPRGLATIPELNSELKPQYFRQAAKNLDAADAAKGRLNLSSVHA
jgi:hypothetical protein